MTNILKSWKTTLVGIIKALLGLSLLIMWYLGLAINVYQNGLSVQDAIYGLFAIGFFLGKDADQSHSKKQLVNDADIIDPTDKPKPKKRF